MIQEFKGFLDHELKAKGIKMKFDPGENLPPLHMSREQIIGVWTNLVINCIDAQKGLESPRIEIRTFADEENVYATFKDHGHGIPEDEITKVFEPFYTTKVQGEGTGLGLTICQKVVKQHGGNITIDSEVGKGTIFTIQLPHAG